MAKRSATSELNHENWNVEEPPSSPGTIQLASNEVMQKRVVKMGKRRSTGGPAASSEQSSAKNAFSSFQGFTTGGSVKPDLKSTFDFLKRPRKPATTNGVQTQPSVVSGLQPTNMFSDIKFEQSTVTNANSDDKPYPAKLIRLNQCVAEWIKEHVDKDPSCLLTPIFRDYERYIKEIEEERVSSTTSNKIENTKDSSAATPACSDNFSSGSSSNFKFNLPSDNKQLLEHGKTATVNTKAPSPATSPNSLFSSFKTDTSKSSGMSSLLAKPDPKTLLINPFTRQLNKPDDKAESTSKSGVGGQDSHLKSQQSSATVGFSFGSNTKMLPFGASSTGAKAEASSESKSGNDGGDAEETDEPPVVEFTPVKEDDAVYNKRCKVFIKKEGNYADLGIGVLYIKPVANEKHQLLVRANTSLGNILVNVLLNSAIPTQRMGKNNVMIICVPTPPPAGSTSQAPSTVLLRVKTAEEADELLSNIDKYKK